MYAFMTVTAVMTAGLMYAFHRRERDQPGETRLSRWRMFERTVSVYMLLTMALAVALQALVRYANLHEFFRVSWSDELARLFLVWAVFWGAAVLQRSDEHIAMPLLVGRLPRRGRQVVRLIGDLATVVLLLVLIRHGTAAAQSGLRITALSLPWPRAVFNFAVPVSATLMLVYTVGHMVKRFRSVDIEPDDVIEEV